MLSWYIAGPIRCRGCRGRFCANNHHSNIALFPAGKARKRRMHFKGASVHFKRFCYTHKEIHQGHHTTPVSGIFERNRAIFCIFVDKFETCKRHINAVQRCSGDALPGSAHRNNRFQADCLHRIVDSRWIVDSR